MNDFALPWRARRTRPSHTRGRAARLLSTLMIVAGLLLLADVVTTLIWQEPVTALIGTVKRSEVNRTYLSYAHTPLSVQQRASLGRIVGTDERVAYLAEQENQRVPQGDAVGRLMIPQLGAGYYVIQGTGSGDLERGPGHYASTALPGLGRTVAIAGHRTTYLAPFRNLNLLHAGAVVKMRMPYGLFTYVVQRQRIVAPGAWWITANRGYDRLVLSACNPLYSATDRIAVFAKLQSVEPLGAARSGARSR